MEKFAYNISCSKFLPKPIPTTYYFSSHVQPYNFVYGMNNNFVRRNQFTKIYTKQQRNLNFSAIHASGLESLATDDTERWLLEPIGDGDSRHIGSQVSMPGAFEIASNAVTVGRLPEKADLVIPVATVSGVHARIQKKGRNLLVTDMDSTNGTFVGERRLKPGVSVRISSGSSVTFGDTHLAMFRVSKLENAESTEKSDGTQGKLEAEESEQSEVKSQSLEPNISSEKTS